ncbi:MAG: YfmQ family protein [Kurthia gibsonii]|uniref:YfmQ family protein n=1 Tax=Kurthia gibsonii TaxID=33946 RepID=A0ABU9LQD5_9BACL|nr:MULTISPECIES: YfmQ family protein [Kurthia]MCA9725156.1 hypothetical protein [Kurthia sp.]AMA62171.1 hypothetical protein ASO14_1822 [Kurthia sp. 11kri321]MEB6114176.1 YfmQ family protein [Kurthia gibsonii]MEB7773509.1 YfmQ family protein [Kurthia gibsonii]RXH52429.1 hypothetical protein D6T70_06215 [Kurthia gibsonii]
MSWALLITLVLGTVVKLLTAPPNIVVVWLTERYAMHQKLKSEEVTITFDQKELTGQEKEDFIQSFNEAAFLVRNPIFKGFEDEVLNPDTDIVPYVIDVNKKGKHSTLSVYYAEDRVNVVKQRNKKVISYSLNSEELSNTTLKGQAACSKHMQLV